MDLPSPRQQKGLQMVPFRIMTFVPHSSSHCTARQKLSCTVSSQSRTGLSIVWDVSHVFVRAPGTDVTGGNVARRDHTAVISVPWWGWSSGRHQAGEWHCDYQSMHQTQFSDLGYGGSPEWCVGWGPGGPQYSRKIHPSCRRPQFEGTTLQVHRWELVEVEDPQQSNSCSLSHLVSMAGWGSLVAGWWRLGPFWAATWGKPWLSQCGGGGYYTGH